MASMDTPVAHEGSLEMYAGQSPATEARKITIGMVMYIATDVLLGLMFIITYIWLRQYNTNNLWFPKGVVAPPSTELLWPAIALAVSSGAYALAQVTIRYNSQVLFCLSLLVAFLIMVGTLVWQFMDMTNLPITQADGSFASSYLLLSGYGLVHLAIATILGFAVTVRAFRGYYTAESHVGVDVIGVWWHWVVTFAIIFWLLVLLQPASLFYQGV